MQITVSFTLISDNLTTQEFDSREAAEESVAKYHEGYFMGNKIRVELPHGGGRTAKFAGDPGACFKCAQMGHWARFRILFSFSFDHDFYFDAYITPLSHI